MSSIRLFGALNKFSKNSLKYGKITCKLKGVNYKIKAKQELHCLYFAPVILLRLFFFSVPIRCMSAGNFKHFKLKVVDNVGVITIDSPGVKVRYVL